MSSGQSCVSYSGYGATSYKNFCTCKNVHCPGGLKIVEDTAMRLCRSDSDIKRSSARMYVLRPSLSLAIGRTGFSFVRVLTFSLLS